METDALVESVLEMQRSLVALRVEEMRALGYPDPVIYQAMKIWMAERKRKGLQ